MSSALWVLAASPILTHSPPLPASVSLLCVIAPSESALLGASPTRNKPFILVVEDNFANALLVQLILNAAGAEVEVASSAGEALTALYLRSPDLIVMDIQLPDRDGLSLTRQIKASTASAHIPIVAVTARAMEGDREICLAAGCSGYFTKPIDVRTFAAQLAPFLQGATAA